MLARRLVARPEALRRAATTVAGDSFDVIIVGGGIVGNTMACRLGARGARGGRSDAARCALIGLSSHERNCGAASDPVTANLRVALVESSPQPHWEDGTLHTTPSHIR
jgi:hypothetical protein